MGVERFDAIVVGAGPSGTAAALTMARAGLKVIAFERGDYPGSKNMSGGVIYRHATAELAPEFWRSAPVERPVVEQNVWLLTGDSVIKAGYKSQRHAGEPYNAFTVLRAKFDRWFAKEAVEAGALLITETVVQDLLWRGDRVCGVRAGREDGEVEADVVVLAEGVNSLLARKAGLRGDIPPQHLALGVKEIISLPKEKIEDRFNLEEGQGATIELVGESTSGMIGTGFIYTNKDSLSVGVGVLVSDLAVRGAGPNEILEAMKAHPMVRRLIAGGETREYMAHLIPEGGYGAIPELVKDGLLVVGDAAGLVNGYHREGSNMAMTSGRFAGETVIEAKARGDFSARTLSLYRQKLADSFIFKDLHKYRHAGTFFEENRQFFTMYPRLLGEAAHELITVDGVPKKEKQRRIVRRVARERPLLRVARDLYRLWRVMG